MRWATCRTYTLALNVIGPTVRNIFVILFFDLFSARSYHSLQRLRHIHFARETIILLIHASCETTKWSCLFCACCVHVTRFNFLWNFVCQNESVGAHYVANRMNLKASVLFSFVMRILSTHVQGTVIQSRMCTHLIDGDNVFLLLANFICVFMSKAPALFRSLKAFPCTAHQAVMSRSCCSTQTIEEEKLTGETKWIRKPATHKMIHFVRALRIRIETLLHKWIECVCVCAEQKAQNYFASRCCCYYYCCRVT